MTENDLLFFEEDLGALIHSLETKIRDEVEGWEREKVLTSPESDLVTDLVEKYTLEPPRVLRDKTHIVGNDSTKIDNDRPNYSARSLKGRRNVSGFVVTVAVPFEGQERLFNFRASTYTTSPPRGQVSGSEILITFKVAEPDSEQVRQQINDVTDQIEKHLEWIGRDCDGWNSRIPELAGRCVQIRKRHLQEQSDFVSGIGLPMKER